MKVIIESSGQGVFNIEFNEDCALFEHIYWLFRSSDGLYVHEILNFLSIQHHTFRNQLSLFRVLIPESEFDLFENELRKINEFLKNSIGFMDLKIKVAE